MSGYRSLLEVLNDDGQTGGFPDGLSPALKLVSPAWTTYGGFSWWQPSRKWITDGEPFDPATCTAGGLHVGFTASALQSGGLALTAPCLLVGYEVRKAGDIEAGKVKCGRVHVVRPVDLVGAIRRTGSGAYLRGADLRYAYLGGADLRDAYLRGVYLGGADLRYAYLGGADLRDAYLGGADLRDAYLGGADLEGARWHDSTLWPFGFDPPRKDNP